MIWIRSRAGVLSARLLTVLLAALALGTGAGAAASAANTPAQNPPRVVMILVDIHASIPRAITAEHAAVLAYARALPADVRAGMIIFSDHWRLVVRPTTSRSRLAAAVAAILPAGSTSNGIYPAIEAAEAAANRLHAAARSRLMVFSDAEALTGGIPTASLPTDVVMWRLDADDRLPWLRAFAHARHGRVVSPARAASLAAAFPPLPGTSPTSAPPTTRPAPKAVPHPRPAANQGLTWQLMAVLVPVFVGLFAVALLTAGSLRERERTRGLTERIEHYGPRHTPVVSGDSAGAEGKLSRAAIGWMTRLLRSSNSEPRLAHRLDLAGINRKPGEWALLGVCGSVTLAALLGLLTRSPVFGVLFGALAGWLAMRVILSMRIDRRRAAFSDQLPDVLQLVAGSLQSGFSLPQALDAVVREGTQPAAAEFGRALAEARIGQDLQAALDTVADRMDSTDFHWTVMAIRIQREVGGNLVEVLRNTVTMIRERGSLRRHVRALSAEGRLSAYILAALPLLVGAWMLLVSRAYLRPLFTTVFGLVMLCGAGVIFVLGVLWMRALIKMDV